MIIMESVFLLSMDQKAQSGRTVNNQMRQCASHAIQKEKGPEKEDLPILQKGLFTNEH
jgi:hypothetical protein